MKTVRAPISVFACAVALATVWSAAGTPSADASQRWSVQRDAWTAADETGYSAFVRALGRSRCDTPSDCINSPDNPLRDPSDPWLDFNADCADLAYMLRAYYAWKQGLPFTYSVSVSPLSGGDIRFSAKGNRANGRRTIDGGEHAPSVLAAIRDTVSTAMLRIGPGTDDSPPSDFYPVKLQRGSVRPGTVLYDSNGHAAIVYDVGRDGRVHYMDSHPDFTLSRGTYGPQFGRDFPAMGAGFKNFRPFQTRNGRAHMAANHQIADYSAEQFFGHDSQSGDWRRATFRFEGVDTPYYTYVRLALAEGRLTFDPVEELGTTLKTLCGGLYDRQRFVEKAIADGIDRKPHPNRLPANIYGSESMEWEIYSTPSRDARLKAAFAALKTDTLRLIDLFNARDPRVVFHGLDLQSSLIREYEKTAEICTAVYQNSAGRSVTLRLPQAMERLFAMSFNPYDCIERRWGASSAEELATCANTPDKERWYKAQQGLRNQIERDYDSRTDFTVQELEAGGAGTGPRAAPDIDVLRAIRAARMRPVMDDGSKKVK
jgi:hypothetical protein